MGFMDKIGGMFGRNEPGPEDSIKPPSAVLRENGIDPSNLKFKFNQDGSMEVSGPVASQSECDRICELCKDIPSITTVQNNMVVGAPEPVVEEIVVEEVVAEEAEPLEPEETPRKYTVKPGDSLTGISLKMYGRASKYLEIFEANKSTLKHPDKIRVGQELVIPDLDEE